MATNNKQISHGRVLLRKREKEYCTIHIARTQWFMFEFGRPIFEPKVRYLMEIVRRFKPHSCLLHIKVIENSVREADKFQKKIPEIDR